MRSRFMPGRKGPHRLLRSGELVAFGGLPATSLVAYDIPARLPAQEALCARRVRLVVRRAGSPYRGLQRRLWVGIRPKQRQIPVPD